MSSLPIAVAIFILLLASAYASASGLDNNPTALTALETKADQAQPRDRCFLYAELVSRMTDLAGSLIPVSPCRPQKPSSWCKGMQRRSI
jgi:hypothetical protein